MNSPAQSASPLGEGRSINTPAPGEKERTTGLSSRDSQKSQGLSWTLSSWEGETPLLWAERMPNQWLAQAERCFQGRRRPGNLCGYTTCPQHSALTSCSVRQVTLSKCSTMLLHTPGLLLCYKNKTKHTGGGEPGGGGEREGKAGSHTQSLSFWSPLQLWAALSHIPSHQNKGIREDLDP